MRWLLLLFIVFPFVELYLLLAVGREIGFWPTLGLTILSGVVGSMMARREGLRVLGQWQEAMRALRPPEQGVLEGALIIAGCVLLIAPGMLSDALGVLLLVPPTRRLLVKPIRRAVQAYIARGQLRVVHMGGPDPLGGMPWGDIGRHSAGPFGSDPFGNTGSGPFGHSAPRGRGGVVDTTGEAVGEHPELPRDTRR